MQKRLNIFYTVLSLAVIFLFCTWSLLKWADVPSLSAIMPYTWGVGDNWFTTASMKAFLRGDWGLFRLVRTPHLAAPFGFDLGDFPSGYQFQFAIIKVIGWFTDDAIVAYNSFFISCFYLCALSFFFCVRKLGCSRIWAIPLTVAFALLPFHFSRYSHLFFTAYFTLPPICLMAFYLALGIVPVRVLRLGRSLRLRVLSWKQVSLAVLFLAINALSGVYFAFFCCFVAAAALLVGGFRHRLLSRTFWFGTLVAITLAFSALDHVATIIYRRSHDENASVSSRSIGDSEAAGLRLSTFMLPGNGYIYKPWRQKMQDYIDILPAVEGRNEYGGALAVLGLICSIGAVLMFTRRRQSQNKLRVLGQLNVAAIFYSMLGGLNILFGMFITPSFRSMNRLSVVITCFSLFALVVALRRPSWWPMRRLSPAVAVILALVITVFVVFDQTPNVGPAVTDDAIKTYNEAKAFFTSLDQQCDKDAAILQLPFTPFPEYPASGKMHEYEHFIPYVAGENLNWSYGAMRGREPNLKIATLSLRDLDVDHLRAAGYSGVELDMNGFTEHIDEVLAEMKKRFGTKPRVSANLRWFFYPLPSSACRMNP